MVSGGLNYRFSELQEIEIQVRLAALEEMLMERLPDKGRDA